MFITFALNSQFDLIRFDICFDYGRFNAKQWKNSDGYLNFAHLKSGNNC